MKTAYGYIRVSTEGQATEGVSMDVQRDRFQAWCKLNEYELAGTFSDAGASGGGGALVVFSLSRLARSTRDTIEIAEQLRGSDADLVSLSEKIDTTTAAGKMVFRMLAVLAEFERDLVSERTSTALAYKKAQGQVYGPTPYGYDRSGEDLQANGDELETIERVKSWRDNGWSLRKIASQLNRDNVPTKQGAKWYASTVQYLLKNTLYEQQPA